MWALPKEVEGGLPGRATQAADVRFDFSSPAQLVGRPDAARQDGHNDLAEEVQVDPGHRHLLGGSEIGKRGKEVEILGDAPHVLALLPAAEAGNPYPQSVEHSLSDQLD